MHSNNLHTVCESAKCPNRGECFEKSRAVFLILGNFCTRNCKFCAIKFAKNLPAPNPEEPKKVAKVAKQLGLKHVIITSVTRDDLPDGGAEHFARTIQEIRKGNGENITIEVLTPDFLGNKSAIDIILKQNPTIFNHNLETIKLMYPEVRPQADYERSLDLLDYAKKRNNKIYTKTGIMVGLGETREQVINLFSDARKKSVDFITIGQYLQADKRHLPVKKFVHPHVFEFYKTKAEEMDFLYAESGPLVRSSYYTKNFQKIIDKKS